jgi:hypothetical protein
MLQLLSHDVGLLVKFLNFKFSWADISLELLDFVIKDKLELLKLLSLLFEINDSLILVIDGSVSFFELTFLTLNLLLKIVGALE